MFMYASGARDHNDLSSQRDAAIAQLKRLLPRVSFSRLGDTECWIHRMGPPQSRAEHGKWTVSYLLELFILLFLLPYGFPFFFSGALFWILASGYRLNAS
jgi:hypothetical protein